MILYYAVLILRNIIDIFISNSDKIYILCSPDYISRMTFTHLSIVMFRDLTYYLTFINNGVYSKSFLLYAK